MGGRSSFRTERGPGPAWAELVRVWPKPGDRWGAPGSLRPRLTRKVPPLPGPAGACSSQSALGRPGTAACAESIAARFQRRNRLRRPILPSIGSVEEKADSTLRSSRAVPHPSTNRALRRLTSEVGRDPVHSTRYGRQRTPCKPTPTQTQTRTQTQDQTRRGASFFGPGLALGRSRPRALKRCPEAGATHG